LLTRLNPWGGKSGRSCPTDLGVLLGHRLKCHYQPEARSKSWIYTIREQRREIQRHLTENPSLKPYLAEAIVIGYEDGLDLVGQETPLDPEQRNSPNLARSLRQMEILVFKVF
jgi:hypothetical protein